MFVLRRSIKMLSSVKTKILVSSLVLSINLCKCLKREQDKGRMCLLVCVCVSGCVEEGICIILQ